MTNSIDELDTMGRGDLIFAIGTNTTECHPIIGLRILRAVKQGAQLIVADPRATTLTQHAAIWLRLRPGSDLALLNGLSKSILEQGYEDNDYIESHVQNYPKYKDAIEKMNLAELAKITDIDITKIQEAAKMMGQAENMATYYTMGITQHTSGVDNVTAVSNLALLTGNMGRAKTGINPLRGQNNVQGSCDMGALPDVFPGYQKVNNAKISKKFADKWNVDIPEKQGLTIPDVLDGIETGDVEALYVFGENPLRSDPDGNHVQHCLEKIEFLVVQDIFMTETAELADVVLPGACFAEKDGTFTSTERRVQLIRKAVDAPGEARPDWQILADLTNALGGKDRYTHPSEVFDEMRSLTPTYSGMTYPRLETERLQWPCPHEDHPGTPILHVGQPMSGKAKFLPSLFRLPAEVPDAEYPLVLTTGRVITHYHTSTMTQKCWGLDGANPCEMAELHPLDAEHYGIEDGDFVRVFSRRGTVTCHVQVTERVPRGVVFMSFHYADCPSNVLTNSAADPITKTPELKVCAIGIEKYNPEKMGPLVAAHTAPEELLHG